MSFIIEDDLGGEHWREDAFERPLSALDVGQILGLHVNSVKKIPPDELPYFRVGSRGDRRYRRLAVQAYIDARMEGPR